ncbi:hydroxyethylthiazole kinase [Paeniglutamicibacter sp. ABSL32-1]|uniref:hydroxyethylthiazole kinase n=1 Tax=Paeniglutamicibacter quisquiliarum TaxID=2849498 RepID=UPI001C2CDDE9|nr:hydroxyethylthiazole kinase [Paeniglutamicibacter quisquiliarum]MBV1781148.1 hydroxyethylthiazole kinase [Paeniglutamicibacter quisquiliarum]
MESMAPSIVVSPGELADALGALRASTPLVQCLTNTVVTNFTANVLLAAGASPAMVETPGEAGDFAAVAASVLVNLGTPNTEQAAAMRETVAGAGAASTPWVLDPVAVGSLRVRTSLAREFAAAGPTLIRGNASEILALAGEAAGGRGVESTDSVAAAADAAGELARRTGAVVAVSGEADLVTDGMRTVYVHGGSELLTRVTGGGCALGAVCAAFLATGPDPLVATVAAHAFYSAAAERAAATSAGPGTFAPLFLDALAAISPAGLGATAVLS